MVLGHGMATATIKTASGALTLDSGAAINIEPASGSAILLDGTISIDAGVVIPVATAHGAVGTAVSISAGATTAGTTNNIAGGNLTLAGGQGKGSGAGGDIIFQTANAGGSGSSLNSLATALTISDDLSATFAGTVDATTDFTIGNTVITDGVITDSSGIQITRVDQIGFLASQNASADANTLDDYEEGTWTPGIADDTGNTTGLDQAYSYQVGTYVKIGKTVFLKCSVSISDIGTMAVGNGVQLRGLPFTAATLSNERSTFPVGDAASLAITAGTSLSGALYSGGSFIYIGYWSQTSGTISLRIDELSAGGSLFFTGIYDAA